MKLLQVNYRRERGQDDPEQFERPLGAAERIAGLPGLQWKIWIDDEAGQAAGGIYLFDTEDNARAWSERMLPASLGRLPGVSDIEARYFDVDERLTEITCGPLVAARRA
jgi:Putative mono-oxygenase ydhR